MSSDELADFSEQRAAEADSVFLSLTGNHLSLMEWRLRPTHEPNEIEWTEGLTSMRTTMRGRTQARIVLDGKVDGYEGAMPGIAEEVILSLEVVQPTYLIGGFG